MVGILELFYSQARAARLVFFCAKFRFGGNDGIGHMHRIVHGEPTRMISRRCQICCCSKNGSFQTVGLSTNKGPGEINEKIDPPPPTGGAECPDSVSQSLPRSDRRTHSLSLVNWRNVTPRLRRIETLLPQPFRHVDSAAGCKHNWANRHLNLADEPLACRGNKGDGACVHKLEIAASREGFQVRVHGSTLS